MKKILISLTSLFLLLACLTTTAFAAEGSGVSTYANNTASTDTIFFIKNGVAYVTVSYDGYSGITTGGTITVKIQKRFLLVFWQDVDGASWTDNATGDYYVNSHSISVKSGTYRVQVEYVIYGSGGEADVITETIEATY